MNLRIQGIDAGRAVFQRDFKALDDRCRQLLIEALQDLIKYPQPGRLRLEKLSGIRNPYVYTIHFTRNHSHKASFEYKEGIAIMRRVGTHRAIDRKP